VAVANAQEAAETDDSVGDLAADLVDHHVLDTAETFAGRIVDVGAFNFVRGDQTARGILGIFDACHEVRAPALLRPAQRAIRSHGCSVA
jgi:hypothetical protein